MNAKPLSIGRWLALLTAVWVGPGLAWVEIDPFSTENYLQKRGTRYVRHSAHAACEDPVDFDQPLKLKAVVDLALCNNPQVRLAWMDIKIQAAGLGVARAAYFPTLNFSYSYLNSKSDGGLFGPTENMGEQTYTSASWRLFDFGGREANNAAAKSMLLSAAAGHEAAVLKVANQMVESYFNTINNWSMYMASLKVAELSDSILASTQRRERLSMGARSESLQAAANAAEAKLNMNKAYIAYQKELAVLKHGMAIDPAMEIRLPPMATPIDSTDVAELKTWLQEAKDKHPAIQQAKAKLQADLKKVTVVRSEGLPKVDVTANESRNGFPNQALSSGQVTTTTGIAVAVPIFDGFNRNYLVREAQAQAERSEFLLQDTVRQVELDVVRAFSDAQAIVNIQRSTDLLLAAASDSMTSALSRFNANTADIRELLNARTTYANAQKEKVRAATEARMAMLKLLISVGRGREMIFE